MKCLICQSAVCVCNKVSELQLPIKSTSDPTVIRFTQSKRIPANFKGQQPDVKNFGIPPKLSFDSKRDDYLQMTSERRPKRFQHTNENNFGSSQPSISSSSFPNRPLNHNKNFTKPFLPFNEYISKAQSELPDGVTCAKFLKMQRQSPIKTNKIKQTPQEKKYQAQLITTSAKEVLIKVSVLSNDQQPKESEVLPNKSSLKKAPSASKSTSRVKFNSNQSSAKSTEKHQNNNLLLRRSASATMAQDCGSCLGKYILCLFNFIFFILGSLVLGIGVWLLADKNSIISLLKSVNSEHVERFTEPKLLDQSVYILIAIGGLMFVLGFLGYCGAIRESQCLLSLYGICLIIILVLEIIVVVFAVMYKDVAKDETKNFLQKTIVEYKSSAKESDAVTLMWNQLMAQFKCCGVNSYNDFDHSAFWLQNKSTRTVPEACCKLSDKILLKPEDLNCPYSPSVSNSYFQNGCYDALMDYLHVSNNIVIGVGSALGLIQLFAIFLAFCLS